MSGGYGRERSTEPGRNPPKRPAIRGIYLIIGAGLAIAATGTLILTDNPRLLKTAVIGAVWACVFALLAGSRPRRDEEMSSSREEELRRTYELEIDREVAARREYELRLEVALRRELENHLKQDLGELRNQVGALRKEIAERWNGELRLERFALRAESTRLTGADRQMLEQQAGRLGLEAPTGSRTEISYDIEQGTSTLSATSRPAEPPTPPLANGRPGDAPSNGRAIDAPTNGRTYEANGRTYEAPANGRTYESNGRTYGVSAGRQPASEPTPPPVSEQPKPAPEPSPEEAPASHDPLFGPLPAGLPEPEWPPANGGYSNGAYNGDADEPAVTIPGRRHRRRAEETGDMSAQRSEPANPFERAPVAEPPSYQDTPFRPRIPTEAPSRHGRDEDRRGRDEEEQPRRRRRYRDDDEENDVIARIRQQR
jgi:hypothetical protein